MAGGALGGSVGGMNQEAPAAAQEPDEAPAAPAGPVALGVVRAPTGHAGVDAALERLADVDHLPAEGHVEVYEDVHRGLRSALTALDATEGPRPHENRS